MKHIGILLALAALAAPLSLPLGAEAESASKSGAKRKPQTSNIVPMAPDTLTLHPYGRPTRSQPDYAPYLFGQPTPIQGTFMAPRYY